MGFCLNSIITYCKIEFVIFDLDKNCTLWAHRDYLYLYDGTLDLPFAKYCGSILPPSPLISSTNKVFIKFQSDGPEYEGIYNGFKLEYQPYCKFLLEK